MLYREFYGDEFRAINLDKRIVEGHIISDESVDAHGSIIRVDGWDLRRFKKNPIVPFGHASSSMPVARSLNVYADGKKLLADTQFAGLNQGNALAETTFLMIRDKFLRGWSVGFQPRKRQPRKLTEEEQDLNYWDPHEYTAQELYEYSVVPIPSNANALTKARDAGVNLDPLLEWLAQHREVSALLTEEGFAVPSVNDAIDIVTAGCIPYAKMPMADKGMAWDGPAEMAKASVADLKVMAAWMDSANPDVKGSYKLPHHMADGHKTVWRGVANAASRLPGTKIPAKDKPGVQTHLGKHYADFGETPPWSKAGWEAYSECVANLEEPDDAVIESLYGHFGLRDASTPAMTGDVESKLIEDLGIFILEELVMGSER